MNQSTHQQDAAPRTNGVESWRMPSGRIGTIDLDQDPRAVDTLREALRDAGALLVRSSVPVTDMAGPLASFTYDPQWGSDLDGDDGVPSYFLQSEVVAKQAHQIALVNGEWLISPAQIEDENLTLLEAITWSGEMLRLITACAYLTDPHAEQPRMLRRPHGVNDQFQAMESRL